LGWRWSGEAPVEQACGPKFNPQILHKTQNSRMWYLMPIILGTWEVEIGRIAIRGQPRQKNFHLNQ
jgi:hypothetical protein